MLFDFWRSTPSNGRLEQVLTFVKSKFVDLTLWQDQEKALKKFLKKECEKIRQKWLRKQRRLDLFLNTYEEWLNEDLVLTMFNKQYSKPDSSIGRPKKRFEDSSTKTKKRKIQHLLQEYDVEQLSFATQMSVRASGKRDAASLIHEVSTASPRRATGYKKAKRKLHAQKEQRPYTPEEALALFISNNFTVQTYKNIQKESNERGFHLYPCYDQVAKVKEQSYPPIEKFTFTDTHAEVELQALLNHTATRICKNILGEVLAPDVKSYVLIYKWGCDGSSGHSLYKQPFQNSDDTDEYMFVVSLVPLRLVRDDDSSKKIVWENPRSSSPKFCRIIKFLYKKETQALIKRECEAVESQIQELVLTIVELDEMTISIKHELILSMIDGKVCNVLSENKSTQTCFICKATSKEMNSQVITREPNPAMYRFGISSLHAYIRTMECLLNITYRMNICQWQVRGQENKDIFKKKKEEVKAKFKEVGLIIDKVKPGFGTSNDGNTARTFFHEYKETARITELDETLLSRLGTILAAIASGYDIDPGKFNTYCSETRDLYISLYSWYNMPATLHKILVHGADIMRHSVIPIGQMSEEASEAKNKEIRKVRLGHTLKTSRARTNFDLIKYMLVSSDPYISLLRKLPKKSTFKHYSDLKSLIK